MTLREPAPPPARATLALFADAPLRVRMHVWLRWHTCPLGAVAASVPERGRVLDVGCGHGLLAAYLALDAPARDVVGVDLDDRKLKGAPALVDAVQAHGGRLRLEVAPGGVVPEGPWDAITVVDVLYLLPEEAQRTLLLDAASKLRPGGRLVVKEMASRPTWKARWNAAQETLAVRVLRITATESPEFSFVDPKVMREWLEARDLSVDEIPAHEGYLHPHHLLIATSRA